MTLRVLSTQHLLQSPGDCFHAVVDESGARITSLSSHGSEFLFQFGEGQEEPRWPVGTNSSRAWHERFAGGWHTLFPHAGDSRTVGGVEHPFHGEAAWRQWSLAEADDTSVTLELELDTVPLGLRRRTSVTDDGLIVAQQVHNHSDQDVQYSWTEHPSFAGELIGEQTKVRLAGQLINIRFPSDGEPHADFTSLLTAGLGEVSIESPKWTATLRWDAGLLPHVHLWQEHRDTTGFPWWGKADTMAIEPAARGYHAVDEALGPLRIAAGETIETEFILTIRPNVSLR